MVRDVVFDRRVRGAHLCKSRELRKKGEVGVTCVFGSEDRAG